MYGVSGKSVRPGKTGYTVEIYHGCDYDGELILRTEPVATKRKRQIKFDLIGIIDTHVAVLAPDSQVYPYRAIRGASGSMRWKPSHAHPVALNDVVQELAGDYGPFVIHPNSGRYHFFRLKGLRNVPDAQNVLRIIYDAWNVPVDKGKPLSDVA